MKKEKSKNCTWSVEGANFIWKSKGKTDDNVTELATKAIEDIFSNEEWKSEAEIEMTRDECPSLGVIMMVYNNFTKPDDVMVFYTPMVLANAGLHKESLEMLEKAKEVLKED